MNKQGTLNLRVREHPKSGPYVQGKSMSGESVNRNIHELPGELSGKGTGLVFIWGVVLRHSSE